MKKIRLYFVFVLFILLIISFFPCQASNLRIHFIDVGEGDSILIQTPNDESILIDSGNLITGFKVAEYLKKLKNQDIEYLIFTHPHPDHIGGAFFILQMINVNKIYDNGQDLTEISRVNDLYRWYEEIVRKHNKYEKLNSNSKFELGDVIFNVIWPEKNLIFSDFNANSIVIMIEFKEFSCLLMGDLTTSAERELLKKNIDLKADVLKVGHHGSNDASCEEFLKAVLPKISILSVNENNKNGYPSQKVLNSLKKLNSKIFRTDKDGDIIIEVSEKNNIKISTKK